MKSFADRTGRLWWSEGERRAKVGLRQRSHSGHRRVGGGWVDGGVVVDRLFFADNGKPNASYTDTSARCTELDTQLTLATLPYCPRSAGSRLCGCRATSRESETVSGVTSTYRWNRPHAKA